MVYLESGKEVLQVYGIS